MIEKFGLSTIFYRVVWLLFTFKRRLFFTTSLTYDWWKVKKNYSCTLHCARAILIRLFLVRVISLLFTLKRRLSFHRYYICMYLIFTSKKQVSKGLLAGDQMSTFSLSKCELCLHESKQVSWSPNVQAVKKKVYTFKEWAFSTSSWLKVWNSILDHQESRLDPQMFRESMIKFWGSCKASLLIFKQVLALTPRIDQWSSSSLENPKYNIRMVTNIKPTSSSGVHLTPIITLLRTTITEEAALIPRWRQSQTHFAEWKCKTTRIVK